MLFAEPNTVISSEIPNNHPGGCIYIYIYKTLLNNRINGMTYQPTEPQLVSFYRIFWLPSTTWKQNHFSDGSWTAPTWKDVS